MSCNYYIQCDKCDKRTDPGLNWGKNELLWLLEMRKEIVNLIKKDNLRVLYIYISGCDAVSFLKHHENCELYVISEYGEKSKP